jgi:hypothetical protein
MSENLIKIYSLRWSTARGAFWKLERDCFPETSQEWLAIFEKSEPNVKFLLAKKMPKMTTELFESMRKQVK